jgi:Icc protein
VSSIRSSRPLRLVQITDSHLGDQPHARLLNIDTDRSLAAVLELVRREQPQIDALLATGDLADSGATAAYQRFAAASEGLGGQTRWLPGNHDEWPQLRQAVGASSALLERTLLLGNWQIVMLDSTVAGEVGGSIAAAELEALRTALAAAPDRHALVCLHHHVLPVGAAWLDAQRVANSEQLLAELAGWPQVRAVLSGHVHQPSEQKYEHFILLTSPSTCIQFAEGSAEFRVDPNGVPGYRWLELYPDGRIETGISWVTEHQFQVDASAAGY